MTVSLFKDKWGTFMSGFAPLSGGGGGRYVIGIDIRADEVANKLNALRTTGALSLVLSLFLAFLFSHVLSRSLVKRINALHVGAVWKSIPRPAQHQARRATSLINWQ